MNKTLVFSAVCALAIAPAAMAEFEVTFSMEDLDAGYVQVDALDDLVGTQILRVGYRDAEIENLGLTETDVQVGWGMFIPGYGTNFWSLAAAVTIGTGTTTLDDVEHDVSGYGATVANSNHWFGLYNIGAGLFGENYVGRGGEMYLVLDAVPAPGALALLGLAGVVGRRRRA